MEAPPLQSPLIPLLPAKIPFLPAKPAGNAWAKPKDWAEQFIEPVAMAPPPPAAPKPEAVADDGAPRERGPGRGRGGKGERKGKGEVGLVDDASRGRGRGRKATSTPPVDDAELVASNGGLDHGPSDLTADLQSIMGQGLPLPTPDSSEGDRLPRMTSLSPEHLLPVSGHGSPAGSMLLTDPAILGMSCAPAGSLPVMDSAGVIMPTQLMGDSSMLQFGFGDVGATAALSAPATNQLPHGAGGMPNLSFGLGGVELSSSDRMQEAIRSGGSSLPLPASLASVLPTCGGATLLPGFDGAPEAAAAMGPSPAEKMLASGLQKLGLDATREAHDDSAALASLPSALAGIMQQHPHSLPQAGAFTPVTAPAQSKPSGPPGSMGRPGHASHCSHSPGHSPGSAMGGMGGNVGISGYQSMGSSGFNPSSMGLSHGAYSEPGGNSRGDEHGLMGHGAPPPPMGGGMMPPGNMGYDSMGMSPGGGASGYEVPVAAPYASSPTAAYAGSPAAAYAGSPAAAYAGSPVAAYANSQSTAYTGSPNSMSMGMAGRQQLGMGMGGADKERRGRKNKKAGGPGGSVAGMGVEQRVGPAVGAPMASMGGAPYAASAPYAAEMGMPPGISMGGMGGMGVGNGSMGVSAAQQQQAPQQSMTQQQQVAYSQQQQAYGQQQPFGYGMVPPAALMANPYGGYGGIPHGYGSGMYQVAGMGQGNLSMYGAPAHNQYAPQPQYVQQQQQYAQQQAFLAQQQNSAGQPGGYVQSYQGQQQMPMSGGGMGSGFNSASNAGYGSYDDSASDYSQQGGMQAGMFGGGPPGGGYYRPSC